MGDENFRRELAYYKKHLDDLAAERISIEHHIWTLQVQLRQKTQGFQLLSRLAHAFGAQTELASMFQMAVLDINSALAMDKTAILVRGATGNSYVPAYFAGL